MLIFTNRQGTKNPNDGGFRAKPLKLNKISPKHCTMKILIGDLKLIRWGS